MVGKARGATLQERGVAGALSRRSAGRMEGMAPAADGGGESELALSRPPPVRTAVSFTSCASDDGLAEDAAADEFQCNDFATESSMPIGADGRESILDCAQRPRESNAARLTRLPPMRTRRAHAV